MIHAMSAWIKNHNGPEVPQAVILILPEIMKGE